MGKRILHVTGFNRDTRARDLAHAFERYGRLVRCDIPGARHDSKPFAFVEYEDSRDAADAFDRMHDQYVCDSRISVQWAKRPPARSWRFDGGSDDRGAPSGDRARSSRRSRSRSPSYRSRGGGDRGSRRSGRSRSRSSRSPAARDSRHRSSNGRGYDDRRGPGSRSPSRTAHHRRRDESAERPAPRDRSPASRRSYSRSPSRSRSPRAPADAAAQAPAMDVDALRPADEPSSAHVNDVVDHDLED